jgi:hypothetical protein
MINKVKSVSVVGSELREKIELGQSSHELARWYYVAYHNRSPYRKAPSILPHYKESHPYRLTIEKIHGLAVPKKVSFDRGRTQPTICSFTSAEC